MTSFAFLAALLAQSAAPTPKAAAPLAVAAVSPAALRASVRFLADDLLEGRGTATRGHAVAARYVATQFEGIGLEPAGTDGYYQPVPLRQAEVVPESSRIDLIEGGRVHGLAAGRDFLLLPDPGREEAEVTAPVTYVGFGVVAPDLGHDDYAGVDVRGRVVVLLSGAPASFPNDQRAYYSSRQMKAEVAAAHGAVGILALLPPEEEKRFPFARMAATLAGGIMTGLSPKGVPAGVPEELRGRGILSREGAEALFTTSPRRLDDVFAEAASGKTGSFTLPVEVRLHTLSRHQDVTSPNVLGVLRGSDPVLAKEYVVVSAHLDHLGIGPARDGDTIYNGAYDNALGTAVIIEVARALAARHRPSRSILFAAVTGEEKGLLGAEHFVQNPTVPIRDVVADLNMDMFLTLFPFRDIVAFGAEHSSLGAVVRDMAGLLGLELSPDPFPEEVVFLRSDHYAFVRGGVPAVMLSTGLKSTDPKVDGAAVVGKWLATIYHSPKDDMSQAMDFDSAAKVARLYALIADRVARDPKRPSWNPGDFFAARFAR